MSGGIEYRLIRSARKTFALEFSHSGLTVRAPRHAAQRQIDRFVESHSSWIIRHQDLLEKAAAELGASDCLTDAEIRSLTEEAKRFIPKRAAFYAPMIGVSYGRISIRRQRTRWGSCSAKGNLSFNCLLMLTPPEVIDSIVVHELCHRIEMNHSRRFYEKVLYVFPDYRRWDRWLKKYGPVIMRRVKE